MHPYSNRSNILHPPPNPTLPPSPPLYKNLHPTRLNRLHPLKLNPYLLFCAKSTPLPRRQLTGRITEECRAIRYQERRNEESEGGE